MKLILMIVLFFALCSGAELDTTTTHQVVITIEHELTCETYVVNAVCWWRVASGQWYVKSVDGNEYWSDKSIRRVKCFSDQ